VPPTYERRCGRSRETRTEAAGRENGLWPRHGAAGGAGGVPAMADLGQGMLFLLLEDEHGLINVVSRAGYERWRALPRGEPLLLMVGG